jgi:hypothetical protein
MTILRAIRRWQRRGAYRYKPAFVSWHDPPTALDDWRYKRIGSRLLFCNRAALQDQARKLRAGV